MPGCVRLDITSRRPFPGTQFTEIAVIGFMHSQRDPFRLLPGFVPVAAPVSFRESPGLLPIFKHCCGKHEALLKPFCALLNQT